MHLNSLWLFRYDDLSLYACTDLQYVAPDVVSEGPAQAVQDVQHLLLLQHGEEAVEEDLEPDRDGLGAVEHQAADVEYHVGLHDLHLGRVVQVLGAELVQGWVRVGGGQTHTHTQAWLSDYQVALLSPQIFLSWLLHRQH